MDSEALLAKISTLIAAIDEADRLRDIINSDDRKGVRDDDVDRAYEVVVDEVRALAKAMRTESAIALTGVEASGQIGKLGQE